jgi:hypothetical protein
MAWELDGVNVAAVVGMGLLDLESRLAEQIDITDKP